MAILSIKDKGAGVALSVAQAPDTSGGAVDSTNILHRTGSGPAAVVIANTAGGTPTITVDIKGSVDGANWFDVAYALVATPNTFVVAALTITSTATTTYLLQVNQPWKFLKLAYSANTNETMTATAYAD